jgi:tetratricopeptide (TPR) repeat protein/tRNA A-37 threonylcarbamoyl transferase component Bud32
MTAGPDPGGVRALFDAAVALPAAEQRRYLDEHCPDPALRQRVERLLVADASVCRQRTAPEGLTAPSSPPPSAPALPVPGYEGLEEIGRGGMGVVYKARHLKLNRVVALKMIRAADFAGPETHDRFQREAEAAARLQHPNIVQVFEVGAHDGRPFFSLEFVEGGSLAQKLAGTPLPAAEAARLVQTLARAVHHAHERGVLHRDLKPGNVLLSAAGVPKITDFGLAKRLDVEGSATRTGAVLGTPGYMAPEQAEGAGRRLGPATDVWALGAILYECLTGRPPFGGATVLETLDQVRGHEPVPPARLNPRVPRDLETVCLKCLHKDPARRYGAAAALADDLGRVLEDRPVHARRAGTAERAWRWCRRNPGLATTGGIAAAALLLGAAVATAFGLYANAQAERARNNEKKAIEEALHAEQEAQKAKEATLHAETEAENARKLLDVLVKTFQTPDALGIEGLAFRGAGDSGPSLTASKILERGVEQARTEFRDQPLLRARLLDAVGQVHRTWGDYTRAKNLLDEALALRRNAGAPPLDVAASLGHVGRCYHDLGHYDKAESHYKEALQVQLQHLERDHPQVTATQFNLAWLLAEQKNPEGEDLLKQVIARRLRRGDQPRDVAVARLALAALVNEQGRSVEAGLLIAQAGPWLDDELARAVQHAIQATITRRLGNPDQAVAETDQALSVLGKRLGERHPYYGFVRYQSTFALQAANRHEEAERRRRQCLGIARETVGFGHPLVLLPVQDQAEYLARKGAFAEGENLYRELLDKRRERFGDRHPLTAEALTRVALYLADHGGQGRRAEARQLLGQANGILAGQEGHPSRYAYRMDFSWGEGAKELAPITYTVFFPDSRRYLAGGNHATADVYDVDTGELVQQIGPHKRGIWAAVFSPDGRQLLTADDANTLRLWPVDPGRPARPIGEPRWVKAPPGTGTIHGAVFTTDGKRVLFCRQDGVVRVWDTANGQPVGEFRRPAEALCAVFAPNGQVLSSYSDGSMRLWDLATVNEVRRFQGHVGAVPGCFVAPDGKRALSYGHDATVRVWDLASGQEVRDQGRKLDDLEGYRYVAFSPDGRRFISLHLRERALRLWDVRSGKEIQRSEVLFRQLPGVVQGGAISPDGRYAACGSVRGLVYLFRLPE